VWFDDYSKIHRASKAGHWIFLVDVGACNIGDGDGDGDGDESEGGL
jgi:hypothetical protein